MLRNYGELKISGFLMEDEDCTHSRVRTIAASSATRRGSVCRIPRMSMYSARGLIAQRNSHSHSSGVRVSPGARTAVVKPGTHTPGHAASRCCPRRESHPVAPCPVATQYTFMRGGPHHPGGARRGAPAPQRYAQRRGASDADHDADHALEARAAMGLRAYRSKEHMRPA